MKKVLLLLLLLSILCAISLRPNSAVEATGGRASDATKFYATSFGRPMVFRSTVNEDFKPALEQAIAQYELEVEKARLEQVERERLAHEEWHRQQERARAKARPATAVSSGSVWDQLAQCEAGGNWYANTGNGYYGGLQFSLSSWRAVGGSGYPHENSRETQIEMGKRLQAQGGWGHWPACSKKLGLR